MIPFGSLEFLSNSLFAFALMILSIRGIPNAAVFPVPVCACPITSFPYNK